MDVAIVGIGIHPFGRFDGVPAVSLGSYAADQALRDAGLTFKDMEFAVGGSLGGILGHDTPTADTLVNELGLTGIQFLNVMNGCATGSSAIGAAASMIASGQYDLGLAFGFDKHPRGHFNAEASTAGLGTWYEEQGLMVTTQFFAMKINRYMHDFGITQRTLAKVAAKNYRNGALNENAWRRKPMDEDEIIQSRMLNYPLTQYMFCSPDEGAAAVILCRADHARRYAAQPIFLRAATVRTRKFGSFEVFNPWLSNDREQSPTVDAARAAYEIAGVGPEDVDIAQIQDTEAGAEVIHMAENGFCRDGEQEALIHAGATEIGGSLPINTDGGLIANGEPIGASAIRQVYETVLQLRGHAGERQVPGNPKVGYCQVYGAPGIGASIIVST